MLEMDDDYLSKSDNFDTQRLYIKISLRVISTFDRSPALSHSCCTTNRTPMTSWQTSPSP